MPRHLLLASIVCVTLSACGRSAAIPDRQPAARQPAADVTTNAAPAALGDDFALAKPVQHGNLTIFPVLSRLARSEDRFITLDEGLKAGTVQILEMGARPNAGQQVEEAAQTAANQTVDDPAAEEDDDAKPEAGDGEDLLFAGNDVNHLQVINRSSKPLYLMPGEIIVGGSQDRTIGEELVIAATGKAVPIEVFCVEHGRWGARDLAVGTLLLDEVLGDSADAGDLASEANDGKFVAHPGNLGKSGRRAVQAGEGQQKVWDEVAKANCASGVNWASGAFTANYVDKEVLKRLQPFQDALGLSVSKQERVVGVVVAINGKIETVDVFESTPLFLKLWPQLLKSYALDALQAAEAEDARKSATPGDAEAFLASILRDQEEGTRKTDGGLVVSRHETKDAISFSAGAMGGMGGGMGMGGFVGGPVHAAGYSK